MPRDEDFAGVTHVLSAYGGMGSFSDVHLTRATELLSARAAGLASKIKRGR